MRERYFAHHTSTVGIRLNTTKFHCPVIVRKNRKRLLCFWYCMRIQWRHRLTHTHTVITSVNGADFIELIYLN